MLRPLGCTNKIFPLRASALTSLGNLSFLLDLLSPLPTFSGKLGIIHPRSHECKLSSYNVFQEMVGFLKRERK